MRNVTRRNRRWNAISLEEVRAYAATTTSESIWNGELAHPMLITSTALAGRRLTFVMDDGQTLTYDFHDERHLDWQYSDGHGGSAIYNASPAPGYEQILFLHHYRETYDVPACTDLIFDLESGHAVYFDAKLGLAECPREVDRAILFGHIEGYAPADADKPAFTDELVGKCMYWKREAGASGGIKYIFSSPLYLTYVMHHRGDDQAWMATHPCDYVKLKDDLYIASTLEERQTGMQLVMLMNLTTMTDCQTGFGIGVPPTGIDRIETWMHSNRHAEWTDFPTYFD